MTLLRGYFTLLSRAAPRAAERQAALLFCFPRRRTHLDVPVVPSGAREQAVPLGGKQIASWTWGEGPRVLLAHGWEGTARDMVPIAKRLVDVGWSVTIFDMPAHGRSTGSTTTLPEMADAVGAVARATSAPVAIVGHSLGAAAAVLALRAGLGASTAALLAPAVEPSMFIRRLADLLGFSNHRFEGLVRQIEKRAGVALHTIDGAVAARSLSADALILHDPADRQVPFSHGQALAEAWHGARLHPVTGLGHRRLLYEPGVVQCVVEHIGNARRCQMSDVRYQTSETSSTGSDI